MTGSDLEEREKMVIKQEFIDLITKQKSAHLTHRIYHTNADIGFIDYLEQTQMNPKYYAYNEELALIEAFPKQIKNIGQHFSSNEKLMIMEIGPGPERAIRNKTFKFIEKLKPVHYCALDINVRYAHMAAEFVKQSFQNIKTNSLQFDLIDDGTIESLTIAEENVLVLFLGGSHASFINSEIRHSFENIKKLIDKNEFYMIFSLDCNPDKVNVYEAYNIPEVHQLILNIGRFYKDNLVPTLNIDLLKPGVKYVDEHNGIFEYFVSSEDQLFEIDNKQYVMQKNVEYVTSKSRKFKTEQLNQILSEANGVIIDCLSLETQRMVMFLVKFKKY